MDVRLPAVVLGLIAVGSLVVATAVATDDGVTDVLALVFGLGGVALLALGAASYTRRSARTLALGSVLGLVLVAAYAVILFAGHH